LSSSQLDATSSVPGNFTYNPQAGTILGVGQNQQLNSTFTPNDFRNYTTETTTATINVTLATPSLAWIPNPLPSIISGTALGADLDAKATDPTTGQALFDSANN
jgi:hypothetical protein